MEKKIMLSIIIPIYNTKPDNLSNCLNSILKIKDLSYEVLMIDDGSEKYINQFCTKFSIIHHHFKYFYMENKGVSSARNFGMEKTRGDYIMFVDSDDTINFSALNNVGNIKSDLIIFDNEKIINQKSKIINVFQVDSGYVSNSSVIKTALSSGVLNPVWSKLFKKDFLVNNIYFQTDIKVGEDYLFMLDVLKSNPSIYYVRNVLYNYNYSFETGKSRIIKYKSLILDNYLKIYLSELIIIKKNLNIDSERIEFEYIATENLINSVFSASCSAMVSKNFDDEFKNVIRIIVEKSRITDIDLEKVSRKTLLSFGLLKDGNWRKIYAIALVREIYLNYVYPYRV